jgi:hypothetical protein
MKMKSLLVALATVLMGMGTGCQKEDTQIGTSQPLTVDKDKVQLTGKAEEFQVNVNRQGWWIHGIAFETDSETGIYENRTEVPDLHGTKIIAADTFQAEWVELIKENPKTLNVKAQANNSGKSRTARVALSAGNTGAGFDITQDK